MKSNTFLHTYQFDVGALNGEAAAENIRQLLRTCLKHAAGVQRVETDARERVLTLSSSEPLDIAPIKTQLASHGFHLCEKKETNGVMNVCIEGMTCQSCELTIERAWKKFDGVRNVEVRASTGKARITHEGPAPSFERLQQALGEGKYIVSRHGTGQTTKPSFLQILGLFAFVLLLGGLLSKAGLLKTDFSVGAGMSFGSIFVIGLVAASSSCIAIAGGLLLSSAAKFNERYGSAGPAGRMRPVALFVAGRLAGYSLMGGLLGVVGKALAPSPLVTAIITLVAASYMVVMGLDMLQIAPLWLKRLTPRMPKSLSRRVMDAEGKEHPLAPFALGAATFFLPCGFTQALQLYALTTGSFATGALSLFAFALGTAPALLALGWASSSLKGKAGRLFFKFSGALVVVLGLWNVQNGLAIAGYPITLPRITFAADQQGVPTNDPSVTFDGRTQIIKMAVDGGYRPNQFTIKAGLPTKWEIDGTNGGGCASVIQSRQLGIAPTLLQKGPNTIAFTAPQPGTYSFSCSMGMYRGQIIVVPNS